MLTLPVVVLEMGGHIPASACTTSSRRASRPGCNSCWRRPVVLWAGWPFFQRGWASLVNRSLNMFTPDRARHRRGLSLQPGRDLRARRFPGRVSRHGRHGRGLLRGRRGHHRAGAARPGAGTARARADRRRHPRAAQPRAEDRARACATAARTRRCRSTRSRSAIACASGPGDGVPVDGVVLDGDSAVDEIDGHRRVDAGRRSSPATS